MTVGFRDGSCKISLLPSGTRMIIRGFNLISARPCEGVLFNGTCTVSLLSSSENRLTSLFQALSTGIYSANNGEIASVYIFSPVPGVVVQYGYQT